MSDTVLSMLANIPAYKSKKIPRKKSKENSYGMLAAKGILKRQGALHMLKEIGCK